MLAEYVTIGHPDRVADLLAAKLIELIQRKDGYSSHAAIEVMITGTTIIFSGEAKTTLKLSKRYLKKEVVFPVLTDCGYGDRGAFTKSQKPIAKDYKIVNLIQKQSPDIGIATDQTLWNDQNISYAGYDPSTPTGQSKEKFIAQAIGDKLFERAYNNNYIGTDIKVLVSGNNITVAIPSLYDKELTKVWVRNTIMMVPFYIEDYIDGEDLNIVVNGTGVYQIHGSIADTGLTGRKTTVNCLDPDNRNGGGSMIKPFHASDLLLPYYFYKEAERIALETKQKVSIEGYSNIGEDAIRDMFVNGTRIENKITPKDIIDRYGFLQDFYKLVKRNFINR